AEARHHAEQFVYWACKETDGLAGVGGTHDRVAREVLKKQGACLAKTWPYQPLPVGPTEGQGPPPDGAAAEAEQHRWAGVRTVAGRNVARLRQSIDERRPVVLSVKTFPSWDYPTVEDTGEITMPLPGN